MVTEYNSKDELEKREIVSRLITAMQRSDFVFSEVMKILTYAENIGLFEKTKYGVEAVYNNGKQN